MPPEKIEAFRDSLRQIRAESVVALAVPAGHARPHQRGDFGKLPNGVEASQLAPPPADALADFRFSTRIPDPAAPAPSVVRGLTTATLLGAGANGSAGPGNGAAPETETHYKRKRRFRRVRLKKGTMTKEQLLIAGSVVILVMLAVYIVSKSLAHVKIPSPPNPDADVTQL